MSWSFEKVDITVLDDKLLNANEKLILILCKRFKNAPSGIRLTHRYFMDRTGIKDYRTLVKCLDRLVLLGHLAFHQPQKNRANKFTFNKDEMRDFVVKNLARRKAQSKAMKQIRNRVRQKKVENNVYKLVK